jgi:hypothetical protein
MSAVLATLAANATTAGPTIELTAADAFAGFVAMVVGILSFLSISGLLLSMTIGGSKSPSTLAVTAIAGVLSVVVSIGLYSSLSVRHTLKLDGCPAETWDRLGGLIALLVGIAAFLALAGILATSAIGAFGGSKTPVTSWPMEQEQTFFGFDRRSAAAQSRAWVACFVTGALIFLFAFGVYEGVAPDKRDLGKDMNMSNLTKKSKTDAPAPKPDAPKAEKQEAPKPEKQEPKAQ